MSASKDPKPKAAGGGGKRASGGGLGTPTSLFRAGSDAPNSPNASSSDTDTRSENSNSFQDAFFDHELAMRKSAPRGGTWKFEDNNLSVEIPLGPVTLFSAASVSIHDTACLAWTFRVEPVQMKYEKGIRRERYCFGLVPEHCMDNPGFLLIEEWGEKDCDNFCRMEGGYPLPGKLHTVMISPAEKKIYFFMDNLPGKVVSHAIPEDMFPCRLGILAFMHQKVEIVNDLHPKELYQNCIRIREIDKSPPLPRTRSSGGDVSGSEPEKECLHYVRFLASQVSCFKSQRLDVLSQLFPPPLHGSSEIKQLITKDQLLQIPSGEPVLCVVYRGSLKEVWQTDTERCQRVLKKGDFFQELLVVKGYDFETTYTALEDTEILMFPKQLVLKVFNSSCFLDTLCERYNTLSMDFEVDVETLCVEESKEDGHKLNVAQLLTRYLDQYHSLTVLSLTQCNLRSLDFAKLPKTLRRLCLGFNKLKDLEECNVAAWKRSTPNLAELFLHHNNLDRIPQDTLINLTCLEQLGLDSNNMKVFDLAQLPRSLKKLWLSSNSIEVLAFRQLHRACPNLELFDLSFNKITVIEAEQWPASLANFYLSGNGIKVIDLSKIPSKLKILDISGIEQAGKGVGGIDDVDFSAMKQFHDLQILDIAHNQIEQLDLRSVPVSCLALFAAGNSLAVFPTPNLKLCVNIQILDLSNNKKISKFDATCLPPALRILNLFNNSLRAFDTSRLPPLKTLWLGKNNLTSFETAHLPSTLKILSLTSNKITKMDFSKLPADLDILNVNHNELSELPVSVLPMYLQQLEMKSNRITDFDWDHVASRLKCLMSINFDDNIFLEDVDERKVLAMFRCIMKSPNLSLKPGQLVLYLKHFDKQSQLPEYVVGHDAWIEAGLPVPSDETIQKNNWKLVCQYMIAVGRSGGAGLRSQFSALYVPHSSDLAFDIKSALARVQTSVVPKAFDVERPESSFEILQVHPHELYSRSITSQQRICVLTLDIADVDDPVFDMKHIFTCLQNLYQSLARVSIIVVLCNRTNPGEKFTHDPEVREDIGKAISDEISRLNDQVRKEMTFSGSQPEAIGSAIKQTMPPSDDHAPKVSIIEFAVEKLKKKISELKAHVEDEGKLSAALEKEGKPSKVPSFGDDLVAAECFWEEACCLHDLNDSCRRHCEKLWRLNRKLGRLKHRHLSFARTIRTLTPADSKEPQSRASFQPPFSSMDAVRKREEADSNAQHSNTEFDLLQMKGVVSFDDVDNLKMLFDAEFAKRKECVPNFFSIVREAIVKLKKNRKHEHSKCMSRNDIILYLRSLDTKSAKSLRSRVDDFKMSDIPNPDLWQAVVDCASLGECFIINNSFFPDAEFVRLHLANAFNVTPFPRDNQDFKNAIEQHFEPPSTSPKDLKDVSRLAKSLWIVGNTLTPFGVFTAECAKYLKHWKEIEGSKVKSSVSSSWRDCIQFFEDCGIIVPYFNYEDAVLQWRIRRTFVAPGKEGSNVDPDAMHAFYVLNVTPPCFLMRYWSSLNDSMCKQAEKFSLIHLKHSIHISRQDVGTYCNIALQCFPSLGQDDEDHAQLGGEQGKCSLQLFKDSIGETELSEMAAILHLSCSKRDSALFRFSIERVEKVFKDWFPNAKGDIFVTCHVFAAKTFHCVSIPLSPIFDENAHRNLLDPKHQSQSQLTPKDLFPRTCSIFLSHTNSGDGTSRFTDMLKEFIERRFICSVWYDKSIMDGQSAFFEEMRRGLWQASSIIICLTPLYMTRPNCLRELRWALDLRDNFPKHQRALKVLVLHPAMTFEGRKLIRDKRCVVLSKFQDTGIPRSDDDVVVHMLSPLAIRLLERLDERGNYADFIDAMPWRSDYDDWSQDVPEFNLFHAENAPPPDSVADLIKNPKAQSVHDLMISYCAKCESEFSAPPIELELPDAGVFIEMSEEDLCSNPKTMIALNAGDKKHSLDHYEKFLKKDDSHFGKSLFSYEKMYLMTMLGFTQEQLIQLLDHPVAFRDQGVGNRYGAIDSHIRKGALLMLSRDNFSDKLVIKKESSARVKFGQTVQKVGRGRHSFDVDGHGFDLPRKQGPSSVSSAAPSTSGSGGSETGFVQVMQYVPAVTSQLTILNETHKDLRDTLKIFIEFFKTQSGIQSRLEELSDEVKQYSHLETRLEMIERRQDKLNAQDGKEEIMRMPKATRDELERRQFEKLEEENAALRAKLQQAEAGMFNQLGRSHPHGKCKEEDAGDSVSQTLHSQKEQECEELKLASMRMEQEAAQLKLAKEALEESLNKAKTDTELKEQEAAQLRLAKEALEASLIKANSDLAIKNQESFNANPQPQPAVVPLPSSLGIVRAVRNQVADVCDDVSHLVASVQRSVLVLMPSPKRIKTMFAAVLFFFLAYRVLQRLRRRR